VELWQFILIITAIAAALAAFIWNAVKTANHSKKLAAGAHAVTKTNAAKAAEHDVEHIFDTTFREELKNRGRLHFEKIIGENAMFLQQDLRLTTSELNEYMKQEITRTLKEEFAKYEESITDAKQLAIDSIEKTKQAIEQQRQILGEQLQKELQTEKARLLDHFEKNMAEIVNHYILAAIGDQIDLSDQLEYILGDLEANKKAIIEDIQQGA
jgi:hypothetical protein